MKVVDAFWEKRNLGVDAVSFHIGPKDTVGDVIPKIEESGKEYQTAIVDPANPEVMLALQDMGFRFIECTISLSAPAEKMGVPDKLKRFEDRMGYRPASEEEIARIKETVATGTIFTTDKISLDPFFGPKKAGIRYAFWIDDLLSSGSTLYAITYGEEIIAFEIAGLSEGTVEYHLGGMLPSRAGMMLGAAISLPGTLYWKEHGAERFSTEVSSNNPPILKIHESFGFEVTGCRYVLVRHLGTASRLL